MNYNIQANAIILEKLKSSEHKKHFVKALENVYLRLNYSLSIDYSLKT